MSADNYIAVIKEGNRRWVGYHACASTRYPLNDCYSCLATKCFEETTELKALHKAQQIEEETFLEYGYVFIKRPYNWLNKKQRAVICPCEQKQFIMGGD